MELDMKPAYYEIIDEIYGVPFDCKSSRCTSIVGTSTYPHSLESIFQIFMHMTQSIVSFGHSNAFCTDGLG